MPRILCNDSGLGFRVIRQLLLCQSIATAGGFPGIHVRNAHKEHVDNHTPFAHRDKMEENLTEKIHFFFVSSRAANIFWNLKHHQS